MTSRPLIIGQAPGRCRPGDPGEPLAGRSGGRLASLCGLPLPEFLARFERDNLLTEFPGKAGKGDRFTSPREARRLAERFRPVVEGRRVVVLGFSTAAAFQITHRALVFAPYWGGLFAFSPHPSGVSLWWNDPANAARARAFWSALASARFSETDTI